MAAPILALKDVRLADGAVALFDGVDIALDARVRACLVGRNGAGKSTLLKVLAGLVEADSGERSASPSARIVIVPQEPVITGETLLDHATAGGAEPYEAEAALMAFDLDPERSTTGLSGGEVRRTALARAFAEQPDVLLLDEPTNHLDIFAIETLEGMVKQARCAILVISHDRAFLERTTQRCFWLESRRVRRLDKGFTEFETWAEKMTAEEAENLRRLSKSIEREAYTFSRSVTARRTRNEGRARALEEMRQQKSAILKDQMRPLEMAVDAGSMSGKRVAEAKGIAKAFPEKGGGERTILKSFSTRIVRGDRVAVVGPNGAGKTTLVKLLLGELAPDSGSVKLGTGLEIAYLDQTRAKLSEEATLWDTLAPYGGDQIMVRGLPKHVAAYAKDFLFRESQLRQPVRSLSGGERNRLLLAIALARPANLLVLDEPTNDLDMDTLDMLEDMLAGYEGTLMLVSHDRDFIDRLATSTIALNGHGDAVETPGGWSEFIRQNPGFFHAPDGRTDVKSAPAPVPAKAVVKAAKLSFKDQHRLGELEALIERLPGAIAAHEKALADPALYTRDPAKFDATMKAADRDRALLAASEEEWLALEEKREALK
jgi:ATP-binding cassette subfamily F protein uup